MKKKSNFKMWSDTPQYVAEFVLLEDYRHHKKGSTCTFTPMSYSGSVCWIDSEDGGSRITRRQIEKLLKFKRYRKISNDLFREHQINIT